MSDVFSPVSEIMNDVEVFLGERFKSRAKGILEALESIANPALSYDSKVEIAGKTLQEFWKEYARAESAKVLEGFPKIQKALFGLELHPEIGERYRDHFVHMFNIFVFGARILSKIIKMDNRDELLKRFFKTTEEPKQVGDLFHKRAYTAPERLNFLWTLVSTFHDVGIPVEHLPKLQDGLNSFLGYFGLRLSEFRTERDISVDCRLDHYLNLMSSMYGDGIKLDGELYVKAANPHPYVYKALLDGYTKNDHGIISAICLFKSIEETFYRGKKEEKRLDLNMKQIENYNSFVFEQDITRAALAIAIHDLDPDLCPKLFPISFKKFPLSYLLILCDELQEYFRLEGSSLAGVTPVRHFPHLDVKVKSEPLSIDISVRISYERLKEEDEKSFMDEVNSYYAKTNEPLPGNFQQHMDRVWKRISERLKKRLSLKGEPISISLDIFEMKNGSSLRTLHWNSAD
jgi:hypothetical protein